MEIVYIYWRLSMNFTKKLLLATLMLGVGTQTATAHPWSAKALAAATVAGLGLGYGAVKYYGFNNLTNAALEKCANGKKLGIIFYL